MIKNPALQDSFLRSIQQDAPVTRLVGFNNMIKLSVPAEFRQAQV